VTALQEDKEQREKRSRRLLGSRCDISARHSWCNKGERKKNERKERKHERKKENQIGSPAEPRILRASARSLTMTVTLLA